jgi:hypothetical protein
MNENLGRSLSSAEGQPLNFSTSQLFQGPLLGLAIGILLCVNVFGQTVLTGPAGIRTMAMGGCGYALFDDETSLFYNPAGLGLKNDRWNGGAISWSNLDYIGLNYPFYGIAYQNEKLPRLGFSVCLNQFGTGDNPLENVVSAGAGYNFYSNDILANAFGIAIKYYRYYDSNEGYKYVTQTSPVAIDVGYAVQIVNRFRLGLALRNLGPDETSTFNDTPQVNYPLPYMIALGCGYKDSFNAQNLRVLDLSAGLSYTSLFEYRSKNEDEIQTGIDLSFFRIFSIQLGYFNNMTYNSHYLSWGTSVSLFNHFEFNYVWLQWQTSSGHFNDPVSGISTTFKRMLNWSAKDRRWWLE